MNTANVDHEGGWTNEDWATPDLGTAPAAANGRDVPVCENCRRIVAPKVYAVTLHVDDGLIGQRRLCRACLTHVTDRLREAAPWLDTRLGAVR